MFNWLETTTTNQPLVPHFRYQAGHKRSPEEARGVCWDDSGVPESYPGSQKTGELRWVTCWQHGSDHGTVWYVRKLHKWNPWRENHQNCQVIRGKAWLHRGLGRNRRWTKATSLHRIQGTLWQDSTQGSWSSRDPQKCACHSDQKWMDDPSRGCELGHAMLGPLAWWEKALDSG